jgi:hypothetical protein
MKLRDLRAEINKMPIDLDDCEIMLQRDSEGNGYEQARGFDPECVFTEEGGRRRGYEVYDTKREAWENGFEDDEWEKLKNDPTKRCIVLYP